MTMKTDAAAPAARSPRQRWVGARYDGAHALLVRLVHPLCFAAFVLVVCVAAMIVSYVAVAIMDELAGVLVASMIACFALAAGFKFVATPTSIGVGLAVMAGWSIAFFLMDEVPKELLWILIGVSSLSVLIQLVMLLRVLSNRWHNGLMHLLVPSVIGTIVGAAPVAIMAWLLRDGRTDVVQRVAAYAFAAGFGVLVVLLAIHRYARRGDEAVLREFGARHGLERSLAALETCRPLTRLTPKYGVRTPMWLGTVDEYDVASVTGFTSSWAPDLPSTHITVLAIEMKRSGRDMWVRRNSWTHDNVLASLGRTEVMRFESIRLSEEFSVRFAKGTDQIAAFQTVGPQLVHLLAEDLGAAQVCRLDSVLALFIVGGALDADELDRVLDAGLRIATLLTR